MQPQEITQDFLSLEQDLVHADRTKRFLNYIIDLISFYVVAFGLALLFAIIAPDLLESIPEDAGFNLVDRLLTLVFYALYLGSMEAITKGKTLGKLITGTKAVYVNGGTISVKTAFLRGFSRAVPFCAFSAFGEPPNPWQDKWTDTMVIDEKASRVS